MKIFNLIASADRFYGASFGKLQLRRYDNQEITIWGRNAQILDLIKNLTKYSPKTEIIEDLKS